MSSPDEGRDVVRTWTGASGSINNCARTMIELHFTRYHLSATGIGPRPIKRNRDVAESDVTGYVISSQHSIPRNRATTVKLIYNGRERWMGDKYKYEIITGSLKGNLDNF